MSTATTKRKGLVLSVAALVVGLVTAFVLGEILLRVYQHVNPTFVFPDRSYNRFRGKPHADDYSFKLNSKGFKDVEFDKRKKPGEIRIIGIGDSFVFGVVPYENNFLTLLEDRLHAEGLPVEIINMGIPGTSPRDYLSVFLHEAFDLEADIVLLCLFVGNDFEESQRPPLIQSYVASLIRYLIIRQQFWNGHVVHGVKTYDDDEERMPERTYLEIATARSHVFRRHDTAFRETFHNTVSYVKHIRDLCRQQHSDLLVVVLPDEMQVDDELQRKVMSQVPAHPDEWDFRLPNRLLASELDTLGIKSIDLLDAFKTISSPHSRLYRRNDSHWNIAGNRIAADNLTRRLSSMLQQP
jgi:hypothetical protein